MSLPFTNTVSVAVIGAGQAGLSAAHHLLRRGFRELAPEQALGRAPLHSEPGERSFVVLDAEAGPGGAWRHRWQSLTMRTVNGIHELPGMAPIAPDPQSPSSAFLPALFAEYEREQPLSPIRPATVSRVSAERAEGPLTVAFSVDGAAHALLADAVINATGTWTKPFWPFVPGIDRFGGEQLHTADFVSAEAFRGRRVAVVGGGISAVQFLDELSLVTDTLWFTRREPEWRDDEFDTAARIAAVQRVEDRVRAGLPPESVVAVTGLIWTPSLRAAAARGALDRRPMFRSIEPDGVRMPDGALLPVDVILWATGFRAALDHLAPLGLRTAGGGIVMDGTAASADPRVHLVGYGPSSSTIGANRAGRAAVNAVLARGFSDAPAARDRDRVSGSVSAV